MASGMKVADEVVNTYHEMKMKKCDSAGQRIRVATFVICGENIVVENILREDQVGSGQAFQTFCDMMEREKCRFILYDCHYETRESTKEDVVFILWCSDDASVKDKMPYASSKDCLRKALVGAKCGKTLNDMDCKCMEEFADIVLDQSVESIEGCSLRGGGGGGGGKGKGKGRKH